MTRFNIYLIFCLLVFIINPVKSFSINDTTSETNLDDARKKAGEEGKLMFVYFHADWCKPCQWMEQTTFSNHDVEHILKENFIKLKVNIDDFTGFELKKLFDVKYLPTIIVFNSGGQVIDRIEETLTPAKMISMLKKHNTAINRTIIRHEFNQAPGPAQVFSFQSESMIKTAEEYNRHFLQKQNQKMFRVQVGVFTKYQSAEELVKTLSNLTDEPITVINEYKNDEPVFKVRIGQFDTAEAAESLRNLLNQDHSLEGIVI